MVEKKLFEIYLFSDQVKKSGHGGHVRFIAAEDTVAAVDRIAYTWGHWWRMCGIREVNLDYWKETHSTLNPEGSAYQYSLEAQQEVNSN